MVNRNCQGKNGIAKEKPIYYIIKYILFKVDDKRFRFLVIFCRLLLWLPRPSIFLFYPHCFFSFFFFPVKIIEEYCYFPPCESSQNRFDQFYLDQRYSFGRSLQNFLTRLKGRKKVRLALLLLFRRLFKQ